MLLRLAGRRPDDPRGQRIAAPTDGVEVLRWRASALERRLVRGCAGVCGGGWESECISITLPICNFAILHFAFMHERADTKII